MVYPKNKKFNTIDKHDEEWVKILSRWWKVDETDLKQPFKVIAKFQKSEKKDKNNQEYGHFVDVRNSNGDILYYPMQLGQVRIWAPYKSVFATEEFWQITVKIAPRTKREKFNNPFMLELDNTTVGKPKLKFLDKLEKEKFIRKIFDETGTSERDAKSLSNALKAIMGDLYTETERFIFELLQNADDQPCENSSVNVSLKTLNEDLLFLHSGKPFSKDDVDSISSIGDSTKKNDAGKTGYKGIGFKAVFSEADTVYIDSGNFSFAFDKNSPVYPEESNMEEIPWQIKPIWEEKYRLPLDIQNQELFFSSSVGIALHAGAKNIEKYNHIIPNLLLDPRFVLFLRNVGKIIFERIDGQRIEITKKINDNIIQISSNSTVENWIISDFIIDIPKEIIDAIQSETLIPDKLKKATRTKISFATKINENTIDTVKDAVLFTYLPTKVNDFKFKFIVNADFLTTASRESIHYKNIWNQFILKEIGRLIIKWCTQLHTHNNYINILPTEEISASNPLAIHFNTAYKTALETEAFILNHKGELAKQDAVIIDCTDLSTIIGADLFCKIIGTSKYLPSDEIDSTILTNKIFEQIEKITFDKVVIDTITNNSDFNNWFISADEEKKQELYEWIKNHHTTTRRDKIKTFVSNLPLFQFGDEHKSSNEIKDSDYIVTTKHVEPIKNILRKLGLNCSAELFDGEHPLFEYIILQTDEELFKSIKEHDFSNLASNERKALFVALKDFTGVGEAKLKDIKLFKNINGVFKPLSEMAAYRVGAPAWLNDYMISRDEYFSDLDKYLISDENIFQEIIQSHYTDIKYTSVIELYNHFNTRWTSTFTKHLIDKLGATDDLFYIVDKTDGAKHYFIEKYGRLNFNNETSADSIEYRIVQLALSCDYDITKLKNSIYIDDKSVSKFTTDPEVTISIDSQEYMFPISELGIKQSDDHTSFNYIKNLLSDIENSATLFSLTKMDSAAVRNLMGAILTPTQYAFIICYNIEKRIYPNLQINDEIFIKTLDYFFENQIVVLKKHLPYITNQKIIGKFINSDNYTIESERISSSIRQWANNEEKEKFLISLGAKGHLSDEIKRRKSFLNNEPISLPYTNNISNEIIHFLNWCLTLEVPFTKENQVQVLKDMFKRKYIKTYHNISDFQNAKEWDNARYREYVRNKISIHYINSEMPKRGIYNNVHLFTEYVGDYVMLYSDRYRLYINEDKNIETILMEVCDDGKIPFTKDDWAKIFMVSADELDKLKVEIQSLSEENKKKDEEIERLKEIEKENEEYKKKYGELNKHGFNNVNKTETTDSNTNITDSLDDGDNTLTNRGASTQPDIPKNERFSTIQQLHEQAQQEIDLQTSKVITKDNISIEEQIEAHNEATYAVAKKLEEEGYDCSNLKIKDENNKEWQSYSQLKDVVSPDGEKVNLVIKSTKGGYIYLSATDFEYLTSNRKNILMVWDGYNAHSVTAEDIFQKDSNVNLIFDTEYTPNHYFRALSIVFKYIKRTTFAVKNPRYDVYSTIKSFGMDAKTEGIQDLFNDNDL